MPVIRAFLALLAVFAFTAGAMACEPVAVADVDCLPTIAAADGHYDGDRDQNSHGSGKEAAHHHAPCAGHCAAAARTEAADYGTTATVAFALSGSDDWRPLAHGFEQLRPPIA